VWAFAAPQALQQFWGLFVFFSLLAFLAFVLALFAPALSERLKPQAAKETPRKAPEPKEEPRYGKTGQDEPVSRATPEELRDWYLHYLVSRCAKLKMTTIDTKAVTRPEATELDLHAVFTELDVYDAMRDRDREAMSKRSMSPDEMVSDERRLPATAALSRYPRLVLLGDPGSGKSTLVNFVTLCLAGDWLRQPHANVGRLGEAWNLPRLLPIRIILRDYAARGLPAGQGLWDFLRSELEKIQGHDGSLAASLLVLERYLKRADGALLLLDGLDEVPDAHHYRAQLRAAVEAFALDFPNCRIVVTTRPYAYRDPEDPDEPRVRLNNFEVRSLAPFNESQIESFVNRWYTHVGQKDPTLGAKNAERYAEQLLAQVQQRPRLAELAENPLLLALMASLHRWREGGALPQKRQELYERSVELLLDLWQRPKQRFDAQGRLADKEYDVFTELGIEKDDLRRVLNCVAYQAHREQSELVGTHDIRASVLAGQLYEVADKSKVVDQTRIIRYLTDRAGLLIEREQGRVYTFPHRTFQEYLAACYLADDRYELYERLREDDERWREAMLLAAAKAVGGSANAIWDWVPRSVRLINRRRSHAARIGTPRCG
jgi:predicted NACHT family NTPase